MRAPRMWSRKRQRDLTVWIGNWCWCWRFFPNSGLSVPTVVPLPPDARVKGFRPGREVFDAMREPNFEAKATAGDVIPIEVSSTLKKFPLLQELLHNPAWESGTHKGQRSAMLFFEGSIVKLFIKIEAQKAYASVSARSLDDVLAAWELLLKNDNVPWQQEKEKGQGGPRKGK